MDIILAPHLDDELIGCYSVLSRVGLVIYFDRDEKRLDHLDAADIPRRYLWYHDSSAAAKVSLANQTSADILYVPSQFDYHPLHRIVRSCGIDWAGRTKTQLRFYSVEMNVPWLEEEDDSKGKEALFRELYPSQVDTITKSDKYFLFRSIKSFDEVIWATVRFERVLTHSYPAAPDAVKFLSHPHRHKFHFEVSVQQFHDDRDVEYLIFSDWIQKWFDSQEKGPHLSCEMMALMIKRRIEAEYVGRLVKVSVFEDGENGCVL